MSFVSDLRVVLQGQNFRRLFGTRLVSQFSDGIFQFTVGGYAFFSPERQATAAEIAAGFAVLLLPYSVLGPFVGVLIDRWSRRQILVIAPIVRGSLLLVAAALVAGGASDVVFYAAALGVLGVNRFFLSALSAALPHVVPRERLVTANAVTPTSGTVVTFVGAGAGFVLRVVFGSGTGGTALLLVTSGVIFGLSALIARTMSRSLLGPAYDPSLPQVREAVRNVVSGLVDGARHIAHRRGAAAALGGMATHRLLYGMLTAMVVMLYRYYFTTDPDVALRGITIVLASSGAGFFFAVPLTPWATQRYRIETWIPVMLVTCGVLGFLLCSTFSEVGLNLAAFVLGVAGQSVKICADTVVQREIGEVYLGRIFSIYDMLFNGMTVLGAVIAALLLPPNGKSFFVLIVIGLGYLVGALIYRITVSGTGAGREPAVATD
ncbi:MFS transporter [Planotetraspora phitsanulokensis]|uniref:MFS transporter n=1 Tax=Planotetraspora phitsanulokensis TaxID=575192 RepID=A0A8J3XG83_9ACTN|nr:MFS transporter [Planotetraspora phitsanulokensis]GII39905.1 MFS transporter [Planotetraspora phitsanulokensis]